MKARTLFLWLCWVLQFLVVLALGLWLLACPLLWIVRDGLGPDSVETTGWATLWKFSPMLLLGLALAGCLALLHFCARWLLRSRGVVVPPTPEAPKPIA
jgi:hypothetical protein